MAVISKNSQEPISLDLYDKKIIFYLSQDSRMQVSALAKKLRISSQRTQYKIDRLKKELLDPAAFMNFNLLDIPSYMIYTKHLSEDVMQQLIDADEIYFMMQSIGSYRWVLNVVTDDIDSFTKNYFSDTLFDIFPITRSIPDNYNPFNVSIKPLPLQQDKQLLLKSNDYLLLKHLSSHPTDSILTISQETGLDRKTIREKITMYLNHNIIQKFRYGINIFKIGMIAYFLKITFPVKMKSQLLTHIRQNRFSGFIFESFNTFSMHYLPPSHNELFEFIDSVEKMHSSIEVDVVQNTELLKVNLVPMSVAKIFTKRISKK